MTPLPLHQFQQQADEPSAGNNGLPASKNGAIDAAWLDLAAPASAMAEHPGCTPQLHIATVAAHWPYRATDTERRRTLICRSNHSQLRLAVCAGIPVSPEKLETLGRRDIELAANHSRCC